MQKIFKNTQSIVITSVLTLIISFGLLSQLVQSVKSADRSSKKTNNSQIQNHITIRTTAESYKKPQAIVQNPTSHFSISIPQINLNQEIVANVDASNPEEYLDVLNRAIAHGKNTALPDETKSHKSGNVYLFAHKNGTFNGRDIGFFHNLDKLQKGEKAYINYNGTIYTYILREKYYKNQYDTQIFTGYSPTPTLTLQTCTQDSNTRLILIFDLELV